MLRAAPLEAIEELGSRLPWRLRVAADRCVAAARGVRAATRARALWRLTGPSSVDGRRLEIVTDLGGEAGAYWSGLCFAEPPAREPLGRHGVDERLALGREADLALVGHHGVFRGRVRRAGYATAPAWLDTGIPVRPSLEGTLATLPRHGIRSRQSDLRRIRRAGLHATLVRDPETVLAFLREWYLPYVHARWGETCVGLSERAMRRVARYAELLWVGCDDDRLAGVLLESQGTSLRMLVLGMREASRRVDGALAGLYYFALADAARRGARWLRTGGTRPVLSDGVLEFKRKWGAGIRDGRQRDYIAIGVRRWSDATRALLARHPVVVETGPGAWYALTDPDSIDHAATSVTRGMFEVGGLRGLLHPAATGWKTVPLPSRA
jgi:hypothetical protein